MFAAILEYQFLQHALLTGLLSSIVCGIIGVFVMEKRLVMISGGIAHTAYGGIGMGYYFGFEPLWGALAVAVLASLAVSIFTGGRRERSDPLIGLFWSMGMAAGIFFIALAPGYPPQLGSYLFGSILAVQRADIMLFSVLSLVVLGAVVPFFNYWKVYLFDEQFAAIRGLFPGVMERILFVLVALSVVVMIRAVGIFLVLALLTAPPLLSAAFSSVLRTRLLLSIFFSFFFCCGGLWLSYHFDMPSGASIVLFGGAVYLLLAPLLHHRAKQPREEEAA